MSAPGGGRAFADWWRLYWEMGLTPVPAEIGEKRPAKGFSRFKRRPGEAFYEELAQKYAQNPIGLYTGSMPGARIELSAIDLDARGDALEALLPAALARWGETPIQIETPSGGRHLWYLHTPNQDETEGTPPGAARKAFPVDIRGRRGFVMAPPSPSYRFVLGCGPNDIMRLRPVMPGSLPLDPRRKAGLVAASPARLSKGEGRNIAMLLPLIGAAFHAETRADFDREAAIIEAEICAGPYEDLGRIKDHLWRKKINGSLWIPAKPGQVAISIPDIQRYGDDPDTLAALVILEWQHGARKEPLFLSPRAMRAGSPLYSGEHWSRQGIERAVKRLSEPGGRLRLTKQGGRGKGDASQYELMPALAVERKRPDRLLVPAGGTNINKTPLHAPLPLTATTTARRPDRERAGLGGKPSTLNPFSVPENLRNQSLSAASAVPGGSVVEHPQHPAYRSNLEGPVIRRARIFGEASEQMVKPKPVPADPWGGFVERVTRHHGMTRDEAWTVATAIGDDDVPAAVLACLAAAEAAGRSAQADLMAHHPDAPKAEDPAGGLVREPVQTDWVEQISGDKRAAVPTQTEAREWLAEQRLSQRQAAMLAGMPSGTFQAWINGRRSLPPEHAARLWAAMNATKAA